MKLLLLLLLTVCCWTSVQCIVVPIKGTHQATASLCANNGARMPSSVFEFDVDDVVGFFERNPLPTPPGDSEHRTHAHSEGKPHFVWAYERRGSFCKVIAVCDKSNHPACIGDQQRIRVAKCDETHLSICLNVPSE